MIGRPDSVEMRLSASTLRFMSAWPPSTIAAMPSALASFAFLDHQRHVVGEMRGGAGRIAHREVFVEERRSRRERFGRQVAKEGCG
jgi:hypothetical protein